MMSGSVVLIDGGYLKVLLESSFGEPKVDFAKFSLFFARANSLFLQEFQTTFHPGDFVNEFSLANS